MGVPPQPLTGAGESMRPLLGTPPRLLWPPGDLSPSPALGCGMLCSGPAPPYRQLLRYPWRHTPGPKGMLVVQLSKATPTACSLEERPVGITHTPRSPLPTPAWAGSSPPPRHRAPPGRVSRHDACPGDPLTWGGRNATEQRGWLSQGQERPV